MTKFELHQGDCLDGMSKLKALDRSRRHFAALQSRNRVWKIFRPRKGARNTCNGVSQWATELRRLLKPDGFVFFSTSALRHQIRCCRTNSSCNCAVCFVCKTQFTGSKRSRSKMRKAQIVSRGHFKPISSRRFLNDCHEYIFHLTPTGHTPVDRLALGVPYADKSNIARWSHTGGSDRRCRGNTWFIPYKTISRREKDRPHPATFPVELAANCIRLHGVKKNLTMLDPFLGIGNSAIAAETMRREKIHRFRDRRDLSRGSEAPDRVAEFVRLIGSEKTRRPLRSVSATASQPETL